MVLTRGKIIFVFLLFLGFCRVTLAQNSYFVEPHFVRISNYFTGNTNPLYYQDTLIKKSRKWLGRKLFHERFFKVDSSDYQIYVSPLLDMQISKDQFGKYYTNSRGFWINGKVGKRFSFNSLYCESQSTFPEYIRNQIKETTVVSGEGVAKAFKETGYDYAWATGNIAFESKYVDVYFGNGKKFIGSGYRSLLLSDTPFNYPFFQYNLKYKKWELQVMNIILTNLKYPNKYEEGYAKKFGIFRILKYHFSDRLKLSFIEADIPNQDPEHHFLSDVNAAYLPLNPIAGSSSLLNSMNEENNTLSALDLYWKASKSVVIYSQLVSDDIKFDDHNWLMGFQLGFISSVLQSKNSSGRLWGELNYIKPFTYSATEVQNSYTHYNQPLAHPGGSNLLEVIGGFDFQQKRFIASYQGSLLLRGRNSLTENFGSDPLQSNTDAVNMISDQKYAFLMGEKQGVTYQNVHLSFIINPAYNLIFDLGLSMRYSYTSSIKESTYMPYFALRTHLFNRDYNY